MQGAILLTRVVTTVIAKEKMTMDATMATTKTRTIRMVVITTNGVIETTTTTTSRTIRC